MKQIKFLEELYDWIENSQKQFLLQYVNKKILLDIILNSGLQLLDIQSCISNRSCRKEHWCPPNTAYLMNTPTITNYYDSEFKIHREVIRYNYTIPIYNTQIQLAVLRYLGLKIPLLHYNQDSSSLYGDFNGIKVNLDMKNIFDKNLKLLKINMEKSIKNSVEYQPTLKWRKENNAEEITEIGQWSIIKKSIEYKQLLEYCKK